MYEGNEIILADPTPLQHSRELRQHVLGGQAAACPEVNKLRPRTSSKL